MAEDRQTYRKKAARDASRSRSRADDARRSSSHGSSSRQLDPSRSSATKKSRSSSGKGARVSKSQNFDAATAVDSFRTRFFSSKVAMIIAVIIVAFLAVVLFNNFANYGKAYGNVSVNGKSVAGMTSEEIRTMLEADYGQKLSSGEVRIYASDSAKSRESNDLSRQEAAAQAEQLSVDAAKANVTSWRTTATGLRAQVPYDEVVEKALAAGRDGGPLGRLALFFSPQDVTFDIQYDDKAIEDLATAIDDTVGDKRIDATVSIDEGSANAVKGHDGKMVDRDWLKTQLSNAFLSDGDDKSFVAEVSDAPSRTTFEQAQEMASDVNRAINSDLEFVYHSKSWKPDAVSIGKWTNVGVAKVEDGYELRASINTDVATSDLVKHLDASINDANVIVDFEKSGDQIIVKTSGSGIIPEIAPAMQQANELLYGPNGIAFGDGALGRASVEVNESSAPEQLTFEQAVDLGLITVVGEYTTEFSNAEGTENRNHNIKLASDLLNNTIVESNGGKWSFNTHSGDTNQDPPFSSAGSIVNGEYVDSIGGGVCQVATTVFNAVYEAGLPVDDRKNHSLYIESYPTGRDAAVSYPEMDLIWTNSHTSDILLTLKYTDTTLTAKLYSTPIGYKVSTSTGEWEEGEKYKTEFETDNDLERGSYYLKTTGVDGSQITVVRTVTDMSGNIVSEDVFSSVYNPKNEVYAIGPGTDTSRIETSHSESGNTEEDESDEDSDEDSENEDSSDRSDDFDGEDETGYDESSEDEV